MGGPLGWAYWPVNGTYTDSWSQGNQKNPWRSCYGERETYGILGGDMATLSNQLLLQSLLDGPSTDPVASLSSATPPSGPWPQWPAPYNLQPGITTCPTYTG
jgi:hypothetical protein